MAIVSGEGHLIFLIKPFVFFFSFFKRHIAIITFPWDEIQSENSYKNLKLAYPFLPELKNAKKALLWFHIMCLALLSNNIKWL